MGADEMGPRLRAARLKKHKSLRSVAAQIGISPSLLSQVETGKTHPSVSTLYALVTELGLSFDELLAAAGAPAPPPADDDRFDEQRSVTIVQRELENPVLNMENGVRWERLAGPPGGAADIMLVTYEPGATSSVEGSLMRHYGHEHAYLLEGELTVQIGFDTHVLRAGDSLYFDSQQPHMYRNATAMTTRGVWFVYGRRRDARPRPTTDRSGSPTELRNAVDVLQTWDTFESNVDGGALSHRD